MMSSYSRGSPPVPTDHQGEPLIAQDFQDQTSQSTPPKPSRIYHSGQCWCAPALPALLVEARIFHPNLLGKKKVTCKRKAGMRGISHKILLEMWEQAGSRLSLKKEVPVHTKRGLVLPLFTLADKWKHGKNSLNPGSS